VHNELKGTWKEEFVA